MRDLKSTQPRLAFRRLARARGAATGSAGPSWSLRRAIAFRPRRTATSLPVPNRAPVVGNATIPLWHAIHGTGRLHLLARADGIAFLQELGERRAGACSDRILQFVRQIGEGDVRMDRLHVAEELVGQASGSRLQRRDGIEHSRKDDRLHHFSGGSLHFPLPAGWWTWPLPVPKCRCKP